MSAQHCIIIGASHATAQLIPSLRQEGWGGEITVIGEEPYLPYNRPPLSKTFLAGTRELDDLLIRHAPSYEKAGVDCRTGQRAVAIHRREGEVELEGGQRLSYDRLALCVGARPRQARLPGMELEGIFYLRTIADVLAIHDHVRAGRRAVIVGGGYIGLETAAMLRQVGMEVTVLERDERVLNRVTAPELSEFYTRVHGEEGVRILTRISVAGFQGKGAVAAVTDAQGREFPADLVIIGIGVVPNVELAEQAGLEVDNGILVDAHCATSDPAIVAAGDCTRHFNALYQRHLRLESVQNAMDQARIAAATVCGKRKEYNALPWFWSDQYDLKLQIAGLSEGYDDLVIRGDSASGRRFAAFYLQDNNVIAVDAVNSPREFMLGKRIIASGVQTDRDKLADPGVPMKELVDH